MTSVNCSEDSKIFMSYVILIIANIAKLYAYFNGISHTLLFVLSQQHEMEHLEQKLLLTTLELEKLKAETREESSKNKEYVQQLIHLLKLAIHERDEARYQLHKLLNNPMSLTTTIEHLPIVPLMKPGKANTALTESNTLSETYNYHSHGSSPVESLFDPVPSPEFSNMNLVLQDSNNQGNVGNVSMIDQGSLIIDNLVKGKVLPEKGKLLQAVIEAGPLLKTLLVAGSLPRWRNPPQVQMTPMLNFGNVTSGTFLNGGLLTSSGINGYGYGYVPLAKRQRFY